MLRTSTPGLATVLDSGSVRSRDRLGPVPEVSHTSISLFGRGRELGVHRMSGNHYYLRFKCGRSGSVSSLFKIGCIKGLSESCNLFGGALLWISVVQVQNSRQEWRINMRCSYLGFITSWNIKFRRQTSVSDEFTSKWRRSFSNLAAQGRDSKGGRDWLNYLL